MPPEATGMNRIHSGSRLVPVRSGPLGMVDHCIMADNGISLYSDEETLTGKTDAAVLLKIATITMCHVV